MVRILAKDRIGTTVKGFKILDYKRENGRTYFYVICPVCSDKKWMRSDTLNNPKVVSCGCYNKENNYKKGIDITNHSFGRLTAIKPTEDRDKYNGSVIWLCKCNCGKMLYVSQSRLVKGEIESCGCLQKETMSNNMKKASAKRNEFRINDTDIKALERSKKNPHSGVTYDKPRGMWKATITFKKKIYYLGRYHSFSEALKVRKVAEQALFDDFLEWYYNEFNDKEVKDDNNGNQSTS